MSHTRRLSNGCYDKKSTAFSHLKFAGIDIEHQFGHDDLGVGEHLVDERVGSCAQRRNVLEHITSEKRILQQ